MSPALTDRLMLVGLGLWAMGVQVNEGVASAGAVLTLVGALFDARRVGALAAPASVLRAWWPLGAFLGWSLLLAPLFAGAMPTGSGAARLIDHLGVPAAAWAVSRLGLRRLVPVGLAASAMLLLSCLCAALQHYGVWPPRESFVGWEWTRAPFDRVYEPAPGEEGRFLAGGLLFHRLRFAHVTALGSLLALAASLGSAGKARVGWGVVAVTGLVSVALFPGARAAFGAMLFAWLVLGLLLAPSRRAMLVECAVAVLAAGLLLAASPSLRARVATSFSSEGNGDRTGLLEAGLAAVRAHPLAGVGPGRFKPGDWAPQDATEMAKEHGGKSHNMFVTAAAETGLPGSLLMGVWLLWLARGFWRRGRDARVGMGVLALLLALAMLHDPLFHAEVSLAFALALGASRGQAGRLTADSRTFSL